MTQNIYDDPAFFAGYSGLRRSIHGLDGAPEWPSLRAMLPPLEGQQVLDLGCGFGWFCRWARQQGAAEVLGVDVSANMLARARDSTADPAITYEQADLERLSLQDGRFGLAYSSLVLHYIVDLAGLLARVHAALRPGGAMVVSLEHPIGMAPAQPGWITDPEGRRSWPVNGYLLEGQRVTDWLAPGVVKQHRSLGTTLNLMIAAGFTLTRVEEWGPTDAQIAAWPELADERERPLFLLISARR